MKQMLRHVILICMAAAAVGCDKVPLLAPTNSNITLSASTRVLPVNGTTGLTAFVTESSGTPVQNGTTVRFTTTLGSVQPSETQTTNGVAVATFIAGTSSGVAEIHAISGGATGTTGTGTGTGTAPTATNVVQIMVGAAAVNAVTLRANPSTVGPNGGTVDLVATVVGDSGNGLPGIAVTFNSDQGTLAAQTVTTDVNGEARTAFTTTVKASVTATAGTKTSTPAVTVDVRTAPGISITCAPTTGTATNCAAVQANGSNTATVIFTVTKPTTSSSLRDVTLDFGDGAAQSIGAVTGGTSTVTHTYNGTSTSSPATYVATARAVDVNGEVTTASTTVSVTAPATLGVDLAAATSTAVVGVGETVTFTATVTGGDPQIYRWDFGDGDSATTATNKTSHVYRSNGRNTATVTVTTTDGRSASGRTEFIVSGI